MLTGFVSLFAYVPINAFSSEFPHVTKVGETSFLKSIGVFDYPEKERRNLATDCGLMLLWGQGTPRYSPGYVISTPGPRAPVLSSVLWAAEEWRNSSRGIL